MPERRVAVTGGAGFIGSHTVARLAADGWKVLVVDDLSHDCRAPLPPGVELLRDDCGSAAAARALRSFAPRAVLHLASKGGVERARRDPGAHARASLAASVALFAAAMEAGARRVVTASSGGTVYGDAARLPAPESLAPAPISAYGAAKLSEEVYLSALGRRRQTETMALRYGNVYGPRQDGSGEAGLVAIACSRLLAGGAPVVFGDGAQTRDFVYVEDVAAANVAALSCHRSGALNVATGRESSVSQVVERLIALSGGRLSAQSAPARDSEVRRVCLDPARARRWLRWEPAVELDEGLALTFSAFCRAARSEARPIAAWRRQACG